MTKLRGVAVALLLLGMAGCCSWGTSNDCPLPPTRLVDVNTERGDIDGRNYYAYRNHELHPDHMRRYDNHPQFYHRYVHDEERW